MGADALMILPPYFEGPGTDGVLYHFERISRAVSTPIVLYNIPQHSDFDITPEIYARLLEFDNVEYIKDSKGDMINLQRLIATAKGQLCFLDLHTSSAAGSPFVTVGDTLRNRRSRDGAMSSAPGRTGMPLPKDCAGWA